MGGTLKTASWKRTLVAYLAGLLVGSAALAITQALTVPYAFRIIEKAMSPTLARQLFVRATVTLIGVNSIPFFLAGLVIGWIAQRREALHGAIFGVASAVLGLLMGVISPDDWGSMLEVASSTYFCSLAAAAVVLGAAGGFASVPLRRWVGRLRSARRRLWAQ